MTPCARGCCWVPMPGVCARNRTCACHWDERAPTRNSANTHPDPTANQAIGNVMRAAERKQR